MTTRPVRTSIALAVALVATPVLAEHEGPEAHAKATTVTVTLDGNDIRPSSTRMGHGDALSFVNYSTQAVEITFIEPTDIEKKIRCGLVRDKEKSAPSAPWALFAWRDGKLVANVPPGRFASVCSLEPGTYAFTATIVGKHQRASDRGSVLSPKGQIEVQ